MLDFQFFDKLTDKFFIHLLIDILTMVVLIRLIYFRNYRKKEFLFAFFLFNLIMFMITYLMNKVDLSMGTAFGLFAVFSMLRYRTEGINTKEMTYLFIVIAAGLMNAVMKGTYFELALINLIIIIFTFALDGNLFVKNEINKIVLYDNIELIKPQHRKELMTDLRTRTGLNIHRLSIIQLDFLKDLATIQIYFYEATDEYSK